MPGNHAKDIEVVKYDGSVEPFQPEKLINSLKRANADTDTIHRILQSIENELYPGITTRKIYDRAYKLLKKYKFASAGRYKLKKAIMELGPTGFPFEQFFARILHEEGFQVKTNQTMQGHCVTHEVDIVAVKDTHRYLIECKFHNENGRFCNIKVPLYIYARFEDIKRNMNKEAHHQAKHYRSCVVTNTRFSADAIQYGKCMQMLLISWDYPPGESIRDRIDRLGMHPLTSLTTLTNQEKSKLIQSHRMILCRDILANPQNLQQMGISARRIDKILEEASGICQPETA